MSRLRDATSSHLDERFSKWDLFALRTERLFSRHLRESYHASLLNKTSAETRIPTPRLRLQRRVSDYNAASPITTPRLRFQRRVSVYNAASPIPTPRLRFQRRVSDYYAASPIPTPRLPFQRRVSDSNAASPISNAASPITTPRLRFQRRRRSPVRAQGCSNPGSKVNTVTTLKAFASFGFDLPGGLCGASSAGKAQHGELNETTSEAHCFA